MWSWSEKCIVQYSNHNTIFMVEYVNVGKVYYSYTEGWFAICITIYIFSCIFNVTLFVIHFWLTDLLINGLTTNKIWNHKFYIVYLRKVIVCVCCSSLHSFNVA